MTEDEKEDREIGQKSTIRTRRTIVEKETSPPCPSYSTTTYSLILRLETYDWRSDNYGRLSLPEYTRGRRGGDKSRPLSPRRSHEDLKRKEMKESVQNKNQICYKTHVIQNEILNSLTQVPVPSVQLHPSSLLPSEVLS